MNTDSIIEKIKALLNLADNSGASSEEAETAARLAQVLMSKHSITAAAVAEARKAEGFAPPPAPNGYATVDCWTKRPVWVGSLGQHCAKANGCYVYWHWGAEGHELRLCGPDDDRRMAEQLMHLLIAQVNRCARREGKGRGRTYANSYRRGMVQRLGERLTEALREAEKDAKQLAQGEPGAALVLVSKAIVTRREQPKQVKLWVEQQVGKLTTRRASRSRYNNDGWQAGRAAGDRATLGHDRVG
jgi:hypothetical protein